MSNIDYDLLMDEAPMGWHKLLQELLEALEKLPGWTPKSVVQVKEKFGGLRFYISNDLPPDTQKRAQAMIDLAEERSLGICSNCGSTKDVSRKYRHWIMTMCAECWQRWDKDQDEIFR